MSKQSNVRGLEGEFLPEIVSLLVFHSRHSALRGIFLIVLITGSLSLHSSNIPHHDIKGVTSKQRSAQGIEIECPPWIFFLLLK